MLKELIRWKTEQTIIIVIIVIARNIAKHWNSLV